MLPVETTASLNPWNEYIDLGATLLIKVFKLLSINEFNIFKV